MINIWGIFFVLVMTALVFGTMCYLAGVEDAEEKQRKAQEEAAAVKKQRRVGISYYV